MWIDAGHQFNLRKVNKHYILIWLLLSFIFGIIILISLIYLSGQSIIM